jgi:hypothetical protein
VSKNYQAKNVGAAKGCGCGAGCQCGGKSGGDCDCSTAPANGDVCQQVQRRAFEIFMARPAGQGDAIADWLQAEREVQAAAGKELSGRQGRAARGAQPSVQHQPGDTAGVHVARVLPRPKEREREVRAAGS